MFVFSLSITWDCPHPSITRECTLQVAYPIIDIREAGLGARAFVESLEDAVISTLSEI